MPFQIKDFVSIVAAQLNHARVVTDKITDFQPGSVARTIMEAPAVEIEELYMQFFLGLRDAIPEATFRSFHFDALPAAWASGYVTIAVDEPLVQNMAIPQETQFRSVDGRVYHSTEFVTWRQGETSVRVAVRAQTIGSAGNIHAGGIVESPFFGDEFSVSNWAITTGKDKETGAEREARFADFIRSLSRGTVVACQYTARQARVLDENGDILEYVTRLGTDERPGYVRLFVYTSLGVPSVDLLEAGQRMIDGYEVDGMIVPGYRAAGVRIDVLPMVQRVIDAHIQVAMLADAELNASVRQRLADVFASAIRAVQPGDTLYVGTLVEQLLSVPGVRSIVTSITQNIVCEVNEALIPGQFTVTAL